MKSKDPSNNRHFLVEKFTRTTRHAPQRLRHRSRVAWICGLEHVRETIPFARMLNRIYPQTPNGLN